MPKMHDDEVQSPSLFGRHVDFGGPPCAEPYGDKSSVKDLSNCRVDSGSSLCTESHGDKVQPRTWPKCHVDLGVVTSALEVHPVRS